MRWSVLLPLLALLLLAGCLDPPTGEISVRTTWHGKRKSSVVMLFNSAGRQIDERATDNTGLLFLKNLQAGDYTMKFKNSKDEMLPAVKTVTVHWDSSEIVDVELSEKPVEQPPSAEEEARKKKEDKHTWWNPFGK